jgi:hypothetical protein
MEVANKAEAIARGWTPAMGTFGINSDPNSGGGIGQSSGGGGGGGGLTADEQAQLNAFKNSSGFSIQQLAEQKRQFDEQLAWTKQMWEQQGMPQLQIQQQAAALAQQEYETQKQQAADNLALAQKAQAAQESQYKSTTGLDYLKTAASLGGPGDYFQSVAFNRGAQKLGDVPAFLTALQSNTGMPVFNQAGGAAAQPSVQSMGSLANGLTGMTPSNPNTQDLGLAQIGKIGAAGGQALGPQAMENLNPDELALFQSGLKASGVSAPAFLQQYQQSRIGQGSAQAA